ncbi:MAG: hypothetical protein AB1772_05600 [Candidatus Zixiibacteriota bacterium]
MFNRKRSHPAAPSPDSIPQATPRYRRLSRILDVALLLGCVAVVVYLGVRAYPVAGGYSLEKPTPHHQVRLQIVDASGKLGGIKQLAEQIEAVSDLEIEVSIVETKRFDTRQISKSFLLSRVDDLAACRILAERLGMEPGEVEYKPLENNREVITATLVVGADGIRPAVVASK